MKVRMTIQTEEWRPDTCACVIQQTWNDTLTNAPYSLSHYTFKDAPHSTLSDSSAFSAVITENQLKNNVYNTCLLNAPTRMVTNGQLASGFVMTFSFSGTAPSRTITMNFVAASLANKLTTTEVSTMQTAVNTAVGSGLATIVGL